MDDLFELQTDGLIWLYCETNLLEKYKIGLGQNQKPTLSLIFRGRT